jgi:cysteine desulfurase
MHLDANASAPPLPAARRALIAVLDVEGNPSSTHARGRAARRVLDDARDAVAFALGGASRDVVFTSGASEANRLAVDALAQHLARDAEAAGRSGPPLVVTTSLEHPSLRGPLRQAHARGLLRVVELPLADGALAGEDGQPVTFLAEADAVALTAAHNETGLVPDLDALLKHVRDDAVVIADAAQAVGRLAPLPARVDVIVGSAHKMGGYAGVGALLLRGNARRLPAPWAGGGQEGGRRPGTEAITLIAAFGAAAWEIEETRRMNEALRPLTARIEEALIGVWGARAVVRDVDASGRPRRRLANTVALHVPGVDGAALRIALDAAGVCVGFGAACSALAPEPSPGLMAFGLSAAEAQATVRLSLPTGFSEEDVEAALAKLEPVVPRLQRRVQPRAT